MYMLPASKSAVNAPSAMREGLEAPDLMLGWTPMLTEPSPRGPRISRQSGVTLYAHPMRPESKGQIHITAADPRRPPAINFNFLSSPPDAELTVRAVRIARAIMTAPAMAPFQVSEVVPGADLTTDDEILGWVKQAAETTYHPVGTCKMGSDPLAVVDAQLRVHGIAGLRVADAYPACREHDRLGRPNLQAGAGLQPQPQRYRHDGEAERQSQPQTDGAEAQWKGEQPAADKADRPVADRGDQHRDGGVAVAAQCPGRNHLHPVEQLEQCGDHEKLQRNRHRALVGGIAEIEVEADEDARRCP